MKSTIQIDDALLAEAKRYAEERGLTLSAVVEDALSRILPHQRKRRRTGTVELNTFGVGGTLPGVDLDNSAALIDLMDQKQR